MNYSRSGFWLLLLSFTIWRNTSEAGHVKVVNGGNTNFCFVSSSVGRGVAKMGETITWPVLDDTDFSYGSGATTNDTVHVQRGHDYWVVGTAEGETNFYDESQEQTGMFWLGFSISFCIGLTAVYGAKATRKLIAGDFNE